LLFFFPEKQCNSLPNISNGVLRLSSERLLGSMALYMCNDGYALIGTAHLQCTSVLPNVMIWSAMPPRCIGR